MSLNCNQISLQMKSSHELTIDAQIICNLFSLSRILTNRKGEWEKFLEKKKLESFLNENWKFAVNQFTSHSLINANNEEESEEKGKFRSISSIICPSY